jgi:hypothetical protein
MALSEQSLSEQQRLDELRNILQCVFDNDVSTLIEKETTYKGSWKKRGGRGAYFTIVRPWDRLVGILNDGEQDMFAIMEQEQAEGRWLQDGTLSACVADVRRYLALVEAEMERRRALYNYQAVLPVSPPTR